LLLKQSRSDSPKKGESERDRINKEVEAVRIEEAKKMAKSLEERGGLKLSEEELANMDTNNLVQMQVEQIEKVKELAERLRVIHGRMDHLESGSQRSCPIIGISEPSSKTRRGEFEDRRNKTKEQIALEKEKRRQQIWRRGRESERPRRKKRGCASRKRSSLGFVRKKRRSWRRSKRSNKRKKPRWKFRREPRSKSGWVSCKCKARSNKSGRKRLRLDYKPDSLDCAY
jgi:translation initiation factor 3 subunit A